MSNPCKVANLLVFVDEVSVGEEEEEEDEEEEEEEDAKAPSPPKPPAAASQAGLSATSSSLPPLPAGDKNQRLYPRQGQCKQMQTSGEEILTTRRHCTT